MSPRIASPPRAASPRFAAAVAAAAALVVRTAAQGAPPDPSDWGTVGVFEVIVPSSASNPPASSWHTMASAQGTVYTTGGDGTGANATFGYDVAKNMWTEVARLPDAYRAPALATLGGVLMMLGGSAGSGPSNQLAFLNLDNTTNGWRTFSMPAGVGPGPRAGHRVAVWGGVLYQMGGWDQTQYYNDLWALDLDSYFRSNQTCTGGAPCWVPVIANGVAGMPPARNSFAWEQYGAGLIMFGGFYHNAQAVGPWTNCDAAAQCVWFNDVWAWLPGPLGPSGLTPLTGNGGWTQIGAQSDPAAPGFPPGRMWPATGILADQLYVYGGTTATGATGDMWVFNIPARRWATVRSTTGSPGVLGYPAGLFLGRHMYIFGGSASTTMWRWTPIGSAPAPEPGAVTLSTAGLAAGISISVLLNVATLAFAVLLWRGSQPRSFSAKATEEAVGAAYAQM